MLLPTLRAQLAAAASLAAKQAACPCSASAVQHGLVGHFNQLLAGSHTRNELGGGAKQTAPACSHAGSKGEWARRKNAAHTPSTPIASFGEGLIWSFSDRHTGVPGVRGVRAVVGGYGGRGPPGHPSHHLHAPGRRGSHFQRLQTRSVAGSVFGRSRAELS